MSPGPVPVGLLLGGLAAAAGADDGIPITVDRIEGAWAVVEWPDGETSDLPLGLLPADTHEGQRLRLLVAPAQAPPTPPLPARTSAPAPLLPARASAPAPLLPAGASAPAMPAGPPALNPPPPVAAQAAPPR